MHPKQAARYLATIGGFLLLVVLVLRGLSLTTALGEREAAFSIRDEATPIQGRFTFSENGLRVTFQQGLSPSSRGSQGSAEPEWYSMAVEGGPLLSTEPPPTPDIRPFLLRDNQLFLLVDDGVSLTNGSPPRTLVSYSALSPDGAAMAFAAHIPGGPHRLYVLYADEQLEWLGEEESISDIAWSPDGEYLAYLAPRDGTSQAFRIDRSGNSLQQLTDDNIEKLNLLWLEDEIGLSYIGIEQADPPRADVFLVTADGSSQRRLTDTPQREFNLSKAVNGQQIAYTIQADDQPVSYLYIIDPQTGQQRRVYPPFNIQSLECPTKIPRGSSREIQFEVENSSLLPSGVPVILRSSSLPLPLLGDRQANASRIERIDVAPGSYQKVAWTVQSAGGLTTHVSVLIDLGEQFPMAEQHCTIANTYLGLPNLSFLPVVLPFSAAGMLLTIPWLRHQKKRWLWIAWLVYPVVVIILIAIEVSQVLSLDSFATIFTKL